MSSSEDNPLSTEHLTQPDVQTPALSGPTEGKVEPAAPREISPTLEPLLPSGDPISLAQSVSTVKRARGPQPSLVLVAFRSLRHL